MENRLKERLTGAAILVALIVLVVPEMFRGPRSATPATSAARDAVTVPANPTVPTAAAAATVPAARDDASSEPTGLPGGVVAGPAGAAAQAPVRSYTIDLSGADAPSPPVQAPAPAAPEAAAEAAPVPHKTLGSGSHAQAPPPPEKPAPKAARSGSAAPAGWSVQLGAFAKGDNAQRLAHRARAKGFATHIARTQPKGLYRVWIAGLSDRSAAEQLSRKLHAAGLPAVVMRQR